MSSRIVAAVLAPLMAAALLLTLPERPRPVGSVAGPRTEPVSRVLLACPAADLPPTVQSTLTLGSAPTRGAGRRVTVSVRRGDAKAGRVALRRGTVLDRPAAVAAWATALAAGAAATGVFAAREDRWDRAFLVSACREPRAEWWFAGAGGDLDHAGEVLVVNVDEWPAVVDVLLHGAVRNVDLARTRELTLAPGESTRLPLAEVAPRADDVVVQVTASRGRVVAAVSDLIGAGAAASREWLPPGVAPGTDLVVAGLTSGADRRTLLVTNAAEEQAVVSVEVIGDGGAFVPLGKEQVSVDPGSTAAVDLTDEAAGAGSVRIRSGVEVVATVRLTQDADHGYAAGVPRLDGAAVVTAAAASTVVQLTGGDQGGSVVMSAYAADGRRVSRERVTVPASTLVARTLPRGATYAVLVPAGEVYAVAEHRGPGTSVQPAVPLPLTVTRPVVVPGYSAS